MDKEALWKLTKLMSDKAGVIAYEEPIIEILKEALNPYVKDFKYDKFGNLISFSPGEKDGPVVVIEAHVDEIGLIVDHVDRNGFISFRGLGVWEDRILPAQRVRISTRKDKEIHGVIGMKPLHTESSNLHKDKAWGMRDLFIDIGLKDAESVRKAGIRTGDPIVIDRQLIRFDANPDMITGKALDNRVGCACLVDVMERLSKEDHEANIYAIASMETELGLKGAINLPKDMIEPDVIIVFDTTVAGDVPGINLNDRVSKIGGGTAIKIAEYHEFPHGFVVDPKLVDLMINTAEKEDIPYQLEILEEATTCATAVQQALGGAVAGALSVPTRYLHCPIEVIDINDALATSKLAVATIKNITSKYVKYLYSH